MTYPSPESRWLDSPRGRFHALVWPGPANGPVLHFAHANGFNANTYKQLLSPLAETTEIWAWDARGHGLTDAPADPKAIGQNWCELREDLAAVIEHIGRPAILAGHSLGGVLSMQLAALRHPLVRGLCLLDPVFLPPLFLPAWGLAKRLGLAYLLPLANRARKRRGDWPDRTALLKAYTGRGGFRTWPDPRFLADYLAHGTRPLDDGSVRLSCAPAFEAAIFAATPHDVWRSIARVDVPFTVVYGGQSDTFMPPAARKLRTLQLNARLVNIADATHFVPMEFPERVRDELSRSLRAFPP